MLFFRGLKPIPNSPRGLLSFLAGVQTAHSHLLNLTVASRQKASCLLLLLPLEKYGGCLYVFLVSRGDCKDWKTMVKAKPLSSPWEFLKVLLPQQIWPLHPPFSPTAFSFFFFFLLWWGPILKSLLNLSQYYFCFMFCFLGHEACGILVLPSGWNPCPCIGRQSLNHWTPREVPHTFYCISLVRMPRSSCSVAKSCPTLCNPKDCSTPGFPVLHHLLKLAQTHVHWVSDAIQPSHPLLLPSPLALIINLFQHQGFFQRVGFLHQVAKTMYLKVQMKYLRHINGIRTHVKIIFSFFFY